jgi:hypothetical protein
MNETQRRLVAAAAEGQLIAYNARDIDAFCNWYTDDVRVFDLVSGEVKLDGIAALRSAYGKQFAERPSKHAEVVSRQLLGDVAIDTELVTDDGAQPVRIAAIYLVETGDDARAGHRGKIRRVWFTPAF